MSLCMASVTLTHLNIVKLDFGHSIKYEYECLQLCYSESPLKFSAGWSITIKTKWSDRDSKPLKMGLFMS